MNDSLPEEITDNVVAMGKPGNDVTGQTSVGATLRAAREKLGLSVADVSGSIKLATRQIEALEADDYSRLPETAFVRGFVRSYAKLLHLEPGTLLAALPRAEKQVMPPTAAKSANAVPFPGVYSERKPNIMWLIAALVIAVVLALSAWVMSNSATEPEQQLADVPQTDHVVVQSVELPVPATDAPATAASGPELQAALPPSRDNPGATTGIIRMVFDRDSWVEVRDRHGHVLLSKTNPQGTEQNINGTPPFSLVIGEAKSVHLYYKGKEVDLAPHTKIEVARLKLK